MKTDCLLIGYNDSKFTDYVDMVRSMGEGNGAFRDLNLAFIDYKGEPRRSMDLLNRFYFGEDHPAKPFHNMDFLWPTILYLGTYLSRRGFSFDYVNLFHLQKELLRDKLLYDEVLTVAITTTLYVSPHPILEIISFIRQYNEEVKIVVGGPYISNQAKMLDDTRFEQLLKFMGADVYVVSEEGEGALASLLATWKIGASLDGIDNLVYRSGDGYVMTQRSVERNDLAENMVDYSLFPQQEIGEFVSLRTAKSCPFSCSFCGFPQRAGKYTYLSVDLVEKELSQLCDLGVTTLTFLDDTFNVPKRRFKDMLRMMIRNRYGFKWNSFYRSDHGDEETIELMKDSGCEGVFLGVESGSDAMLERMNKTSRRRNYMQAIPLLNQAGISTHANFIIGFPGETYDSVAESISLIEEAKPEFYRAQLWYCDPVTPIWNQRDQYGVQGSAFNWTHDSMDQATACDLVDRFFVCIENSTWMPQQGFEEWSTFYLNRKGMSHSRIKSFIRYFNACVKHKLIHGGETPVAEDLLEGLRRSARFRTAEQPGMAPVEIYSGAGYMAAERYYLEEFALARPPATFAASGTADAEEGYIAVSCTIGRDVADQLCWTSEDDLPQMTLAAFSLLLAQLSGEEEMVMVASTAHGGRGLPLRLAPSEDKSFEAFVEEVESKVEAARQHGLYGFEILTNPWRMAQGASECPSFKIGFSFRETPAARGATFAELLDCPIEVAESLVLVLEVRAAGDDVAARILYSPVAFGRKAVERIAASYGGILERVLEDPDIHLGELRLNRNIGIPTSVIGAAVSSGIGDRSV